MSRIKPPLKCLLSDVWIIGWNVKSLHNSLPPVFIDNLDNCSCQTNRQNSGVEQEYKMINLSMNLFFSKLISWEN